MRFSGSGGGWWSAQPHPRGRAPWRQTPLEADPPEADHPVGRPPGRNMGPGIESPLEGTWNQAARQEVTSYRDPPWTDKHL